MYSYPDQSMKSTIIYYVVTLSSHIQLLLSYGFPLFHRVENSSIEPYFNHTEYQRRGEKERKDVETNNSIRVWIDCQRYEPGVGENQATPFSRLLIPLDI